MQTYRTPARLLHWIVALIVLATIPVGQLMVQEGLSRPIQNGLYLFHKNAGVLILLLVIARLVYRWRHPPPPLPADMPSLQRRVAHGTHVALYTLLVVMAVSGYVRVRAGGFPIESLDALGVPSLIPRSEALEKIAKATHAYARFALVLAILLHLAGSLYHGLVKRDGMLARMWPPVAR